MAITINDIEQQILKLNPRDDNRIVIQYLHEHAIEVMKAVDLEYMRQNPVGPMIAANPLGLPANIAFAIKTLCDEHPQPKVEHDKHAGTVRGQLFAVIDPLLKAGNSNREIAEELDNHRHLQNDSLFRKWVKEDKKIQTWSDAFDNEKCNNRFNVFLNKRRRDLGIIKTTATSRKTRRRLNI